MSTFEFDPYLRVSRLTVSNSIPGPLIPELVTEAEPDPEVRSAPAPVPEEAARSAPAPEPASPSKILTLRVGERHFTTTSATLTSESGFFSSMFSGQWHNMKQPDGSYFIDADPDLFAHILRYLRHTILPIFYTNGTGHDYGLYAALLGEARYFQIDRLVRWLEGKRYLHAVTVERIPEEVEGSAALQEKTLANEEVDYHAFETTREVYVCPRGIFVHRGDSSRCGKDCIKARGMGSVEYEEEPVLKVLLIRKRTVFNHELCFEG